MAKAKKKNYSKLSKKELIAEISELLESNQYGLVWENKEEDVVKRCQRELPVLEEVKNKEIITDPNKPINLLIEGDNYHALSVLNYTHAGKIDVIYIDPPYNTGARDWKYNNNYVDINDRWRHSKWLSFMEHRLRLAKNLLSPQGVLICTIDHNEQEALGLLLKELFRDKEITCVTIVHNPSGIQGKNFSYNNEYAYFVYPAGDKKVIAFEKRTDENADVRQFMNTAKGRSRNYLRESGYNCFYSIYVKNSKIVGFGNICKKSFHPKKSNVRRKNGIVEVYPIDANGVERKWVFSRKNVETIKKDLSVNVNKKTGETTIIRTKKEINYKTVWIGEKFNAKTYGTQLLNDILRRDFPFPKSLYAVEECIKAVVHDKYKATVLDFFAGSGTTAHAVLDLNKNDEGGRKFVLCTNNEDNNGNGYKIAEDICYPRIKRVIRGYKNLKNQRIKGLGGNLKYFRTAFIPKTRISDDTKYKIVGRSTEMICIKEDTFDEILSKKYIKIFRNKNQYTAILFRLDYFDDFKKELRNLNKPIHIYVFSLTNDTYEADFKDLKQKFDLCPIPESILEVYRKIFKE